jgi:DNA-3-methyladenine glycosylase II
MSTELTNSFTAETLIKYCKQLCKKDTELRDTIEQYGFPPFWHREPNFETLIHIILEQQVSLASARAAMDQLRAKLPKITPAILLSLSDEEMRACYFSRQKMVYARALAQAITDKILNLKKLNQLDDATIRTELKKIKGIGDWTVDVYLMMALHRPNFFPTGDIALMNRLKEIKGLTHLSKDQALTIAQAWEPYRTIAAYILWWGYICKRKIKF